MNNQLTIYDFMKPRYPDSHDEILRYHAEVELEKKIVPKKCCKKDPIGMFSCCHEYWLECPVCRRRSKVCERYYQAIQEWNKE